MANLMHRVLHHKEHIWHDLPSFFWLGMCKNRLLDRLTSGTTLFLALDTLQEPFGSLTAYRQDDQVAAELLACQPHPEYAAIE